MRPRASKPARSRSASASDALEVGEALGQPLDGDRVGARFDLIFGGYSHVVLAVSGGVDSCAMMHLAAEWRAARLASIPAQSAPIFSVVTVDHGLRPELAVEADAVQDAAARLGFAHATLAWTGAKPAAGIQAAARAARYRLLREHLAAHGIEALATAHTSDDQAETVLMRLARGSGVDGLAGMQEIKKLGHIAVLRPMLGFAKADLVATLTARGETWIEDPSNDMLAFERVRLRHQRESFEAAGLSNRAIALSARRLGRARAALDEMAVSSVKQAEGMFRIDDLGYAEFSWNWMLTLPEEIRLRILGRLIAAIGGGDEPVSMSGLEAMTEGIGWKPPVGHTLAGTVFGQGRAPDAILVTREFGRKHHPLPSLDLKSGQTQEWDHRFTVVNRSEPSRDFRVCALGAEGIAILKAVQLEADRDLMSHPLPALRTIPSFWDRDRLAAVPLLNYFETGMVASEAGSYLTTQPFSG